MNTFIRIVSWLRRPKRPDLKPVNAEIATARSRHRRSSDLVRKRQSITTDRLKAEVKARRQAGTA